MCCNTLRSSRDCKRNHSGRTVTLTKLAGVNVAVQKGLLKSQNCLVREEHSFGQQLCYTHRISGGCKRNHSDRVLLHSENCLGGKEQPANSSATLTESAGER
jgi:hypothetical protein